MELRSAPPADVPASEVHAEVAIRPLESLEELQAAVALQEQVWGAGFRERVPVSLLVAATHVGALVAGAFAGPRLVGMVFGLTGVRDGRPVHWSHMLAVDESERNRGIGRMLKAWQRRELARRGIGEMSWTFDPMLARNAHLNLEVLGARVVRYVPDMYGGTDSPLHHGLATDRLVVACATDAAPRPRPAPADDAVPVLTPEPRAGDPLVGEAGAVPPRLRVEIPGDFASVAAASPPRASAWQAATRAAFARAHDAGLAVSRFERASPEGRAFYHFAAPERAP